LGFGINNHVGLKNRANWSATLTRPSIVTPEGQPPSTRAVAINNMGLAIGYDMMTRFVVPFEVAGLLLTAALVGAIALAHREGDDEPTRLGAQVTGAHGATEPSGSNGQAGHGGARSEQLSSPSK
jgi:NADH-quinone oxidoreductase subunit J